MSHPTGGEYAPCNACTSGEPQRLYDGGLCAKHYRLDRAVTRLELVANCDAPRDSRAWDDANLALQDFDLETAQQLGDGWAR